MNKLRPWSLLVLAAILALALAACDANDLTIGGRDREGLAFASDTNDDGRVDVNDLEIEDEVEFTGIVESISGDEWVVSDCRVYVADETEIEDKNGDDDGDDDEDNDDEDNDGDNDGDDEDNEHNVDVGDPVKVQAWLTTDDHLVAREIKIAGLDELDQDALDDDGEDEDDGDDNELCLLVRDGGNGSGDRDGSGNGDGNGNGNGNDKNKDGNPNDNDNGRGNDG